MRALARITTALVLACTGAAIAPGCQEPTQVTVDIKLVTAQCSEVHGLAIVVGQEPLDTEQRVRSRFPTAQTTDCDPATSEIGTLVLTPSDNSDDAAIVVTAGYADVTNPTNCQPPDFHDCIVARRRFTFVKHKRLTVPIEIDPTCVNVPCDAFSTCRKGQCYPSDISCDNGACETPGRAEDGGDLPPPPDDSGTIVTPPDGSVVPPGAAPCSGTTLRCGMDDCAPPGICCSASATSAFCQKSGGVCPKGSKQLCCSANDCGGTGCMHTSGTLNCLVLPDGGPCSDGGIDAATFDSGGVGDSGFDSGSPPVDSGTPPGDSGTGDS